MTAPKHSPDYGRLTSSLNRSKSKQEDNALYQTTSQLITGVKKLNDFIDASFLSVFNNLNDASGALAQLSEIIAEINLALSLLAVRDQQGLIGENTLLIPDNTLTVIATFVIIDAAQYNMNAGAVFDINGIGYRFLGIYLDGVVKRRVQVVAGNNPTGLSVSALLQCLAGSVVEVKVEQTSGGDLNCEFAVDIIRLSYV